MKKIKIYFEIPSDVLLPADSLDVLSLFKGEYEKKIEDEIRDAVIEKVLPKIKIPRVEITASEVKEKMLYILAERALDEMDKL